MNAAPVYDLILQGGHVICPASGIDGVMDVAIAGGKIAQVSKNIIPSSAKQTIDVRGKLVLPGMIDTHAHIYRYVTGRFGLDADMCGVQSGVTTLIDQCCHPGAHPHHVGVEPEPAGDMAEHMGVRVDHPGQDERAADVDIRPGGREVRPDRGDPPLRDRDIANRVDALGRVDHPSAAQHQIETLRHPSTSRSLNPIMIRCEVCHKHQSRPRGAALMPKTYWSADRDWSS